MQSAFFFVVYTVLRKKFWREKVNPCINKIFYLVSSVYLHSSLFLYHNEYQGSVLRRYKRKAKKKQQPTMQEHSIITYDTTLLFFRDKNNTDTRGNTVSPHSGFFHPKVFQYRRYHYSSTHFAVHTDPLHYWFDIYRDICFKFSYWIPCYLLFHLATAARGS